MVPGAVTSDGEWLPGDLVVDIPSPKCYAKGFKWKAALDSSSFLDL